MKLKSYFSGTVEAAMELARKELGEDAFLVNARPADPETRKLGAFEVVFGVMPPQAPEAAAASPLPAVTLPAASPANTDLTELKREMARMADRKSTRLNSSH